MMRRCTQVGIVGAGPAGALALSHLLHRAGIESVVLESRDRDYVEHRVRAGVLEQGTVDLLVDSGVGDRLQREGLTHHGIEPRFGGRGHRIDMTALTGGRSIVVYGQQEVVKDLIRARLGHGGAILFDVDRVALHGIETTQPTIRYVHGGEDVHLDCDVTAGCDGFHGVSRQAVPAGVLSIFERWYPVRSAGHPRQGAADARGTHLRVSRPRLRALQHAFAGDHAALPAGCARRRYRGLARREDLGRAAHAPRNRRWLDADRGAGARKKSVTGMRSFVTEPMQHGRLFLAGDAAHIVPPTGLKGMNLAVADVRTLARALAAFYADGREDLLAAYSQTCLKRIWQGNIAERIRAAGAGIGAFFTPTAYGTPLAEGKETREINGRQYVLEYPLFADYALHQGPQGRPARQPRLSQDGAQFRSRHGDRRQVHHRPGHASGRGRRPSIPKRW